MQLDDLNFDNLNHDRSRNLDHVTKDEAIDRQAALLEKALEIINDVFIAIGGDQYDVNDFPGEDFPRGFIIPLHPVSKEDFKRLWDVREEICGNSAFMEIAIDNTYSAN